MITSLETTTPHEIATLARYAIKVFTAEYWTECAIISARKGYDLAAQSCDENAEFWNSLIPHDAKYLSCDVAVSLVKDAMRDARLAAENPREYERIVAEYRGCERMALAQYNRYG